MGEYTWAVVSGGNPTVKYDLRLHNQGDRINGSGYGFLQEP